MSWTRTSEGKPQKYRHQWITIQLGTFHGPAYEDGAGVWRWVSDDSVVEEPVIAFRPVHCPRPYKEKP